MTNNNIEVEEIEAVDYRGFMQDSLKASHEIESLETLRQLTGTTQIPPKKQREVIKEQIRLRKKFMAGMHKEIRELEKLL